MTNIAMTNIAKMNIAKMNIAKMNIAKTNIAMTITAMTITMTMIVEETAAAEERERLGVVLLLPQVIVAVLIVLPVFSISLAVE